MFKHGKKQYFKNIADDINCNTGPGHYVMHGDGTFWKYRSGGIKDQGITTFEVVKGDIVQEITTTGNVDSKTLNTYKARLQ